MRRFLSLEDFAYIKRLRSSEIATYRGCLARLRPNEKYRLSPVGVSSKAASRAPESGIGMMYPSQRVAPCKTKLSVVISVNHVYRLVARLCPHRTSSDFHLVHGQRSVEPTEHVISGNLWRSGKTHADAATKVSRQIDRVVRIRRLTTWNSAAKHPPERSEEGWASAAIPC